MRRELDKIFKSLSTLHFYCKFCRGLFTINKDNLKKWSKRP